MQINLSKEELKLLKYCLGIEFTGYIVDGINCSELLYKLGEYINE